MWPSISRNHPRPTSLSHFLQTLFKSSLPTPVLFYRLVFCRKEESGIPDFFVDMTQSKF
jgi:hypothetical protein